MTENRQKSSCACSKKWPKTYEEAELAQNRGQIWTRHAKKPLLFDNIHGFEFFSIFWVPTLSYLPLLPERTAAGFPALGSSHNRPWPWTKFLGINLDNNLIFKWHIVEVCRKSILYYFWCVASDYISLFRPWLTFYYTFFYPQIIYGVELYGHAANCHLNQIFLLQKSALARVTLSIRPRNHATSHFSNLKIIPIDIMIFKYRSLN